LQEPGSHVEEVVKQTVKNSSRKKIIWGGFKQGYWYPFPQTQHRYTCGTSQWFQCCTLHKILPTKVDPLVVSLMKVEAVPDSTNETIGDLEKQIIQIK
jgi:hypothetical protein